jgi:DNA-binding MarR family transcriptional regulator
MHARSPSLGPEERLFQSVLRTADHLLRGEVELLRLVDLTFSQYNVLRILRGARPDGLSAGAIAERMVHRDSDMTRLLEGLARRGLVSRTRGEDRRVVIARITADGLELLRGLDAPVGRVHREQLRHLSRRQLESLIELLDLARRPSGA